MLSIFFNIERQIYEQSSKISWENKYKASNTVFLTLSPWYFPVLLLAHLMLLFLNPGWNLKLDLCSRLLNDVRSMLGEKGNLQTWSTVLCFCLCIYVLCFCLIGILKKIILLLPSQPPYLYPKSLFYIFPHSSFFLLKSPQGYLLLQEENISPHKELNWIIVSLLNSSIFPFSEDNLRLYSLPPFVIYTHQISWFLSCYMNLFVCVWTPSPLFTSYVTLDNSISLSKQPFLICKRVI